MVETATQHQKFFKRGQQKRANMADAATRHKIFEMRTTINKLLPPRALCASSSHFLTTHFLSTHLEICRSILTLFTSLAESMTWSMTWKWTLLATYLLSINKICILKQRGRGSKCTYGRIGNLVKYWTRFILKSTLCPIIYCYENES